MPPEQKRTPPKEGSIPAKIETVDADGKEIFTENYRIGYAGQCTWYARGRFHEVNGVELPTIGYAKDWLMAPLVSDKVDVCLDVNVVPEHSIAVYAPKADSRLKGHVVFVEYVERDKDGNPVNVYYTDAKTEIDNKNNALKASKQEKQTKVDNLNSDQKKIQKEIDDMEAELQKIYDSGSRTDGDVYSGQLRWPLTGYGKDWITSPFGYR